ncbi:AbrB/MazE/SpoVT family DNA-binding domain-containing protein [Arcobacter cloacae]|uniref:AbrB/MazE/SpoVT family DNA-binding domain-containing protein n=1 Tax=Arcobacter cloacae TaxID=1054034 RepID=A0A6M8NMI8_9BACT|nr:AbrB/MazE/SpoVT family DNA-binding domain-containing protein [Arcobacter cloacae]QKF89627.1 toxin-antitoxin system, antitoxin component, MazE family [Arcobacter cloacae]RXI42862.1 AbrB/MazE/SpoVT family DNA-binding domain-containing protein [Arcobacter cloacae]
MTMLTKIGNSQGIRIPKALIKEAHLENVEIDLEVVENGLLLKPIKKNTRENWEENIKQVLEKNKNKKDEAILEDFLNDSDLEDYEW